MDYIPTQPLVSIVCCCYNHQAFVAEALQSLLNQTYKNIEIIVIDDASTDASVAEIERTIEATEAQILLIENSTNRGHCASLNVGLAASTGKYIMDFSTDDVLFPSMIAEQVAFFETLPPSVGVVFADAWLVDVSGKQLRTFYERDNQGKLKKPVAEGDLFEVLLSKYAVLAPTMMIRRELLESLGGFDEQLVYEDYDFYLQSSRNWQYRYLDKPLMAWRQSLDSGSKQFFKPRNEYLVSTLKAQQKAIPLLRTEAEKRSMARHSRYFIRQCLLTQHYELAFGFAQILKDITQPTGLLTQAVLGVCKVGKWIFG